MKRKIFLHALSVIIIFFIASHVMSADITQQQSVPLKLIITSDTILSGMLSSLLPPERYSVASILPPGQCPGHYDMKLSDVEKIKKADLNISFKGMGFMSKTGTDDGRQVLVDAGSRNWMAPDSYIHGLEMMAGILSRRFPEDAHAITNRKNIALRDVKEKMKKLREAIGKAEISGSTVIASSLQKEPLVWMGLSVVGEYGRPEAMSAKEFTRLVKTGKDRNVIMVVDNLQSGPDTGKGIAETLGVPHVVLTNFPSEKGYSATLGKNVESIMQAAKKKR